MYDENEIINDLDMSWIEQFDKMENEYKDYYSEDIPFIIVHSIYLNEHKEIIKVKEDKILLKTHGIMNKEELMTIIKQNSCFNQNKYSLISILKFNLNLEPENLKTFIKNNDSLVGNSFLQSIKNIDSIKFDKTISMFQDLNDLIIIYKIRDLSNVCTNKKTTKKHLTHLSNTAKKTTRKNT
jgi:hypothetical protein